jgi:hypothetical protein
MAQIGASAPPEASETSDARPDRRSDANPDVADTMLDDARARGDHARELQRDARRDDSREDQRDARRRELRASLMGWAALAGASGALCAAAFLSRWFSDAIDSRDAITWASFAPAGLVLTEAITALATGIVAALALGHLRAGRIKRAYALVIIIAGVRGAAVALMADARFRRAWDGVLRDAWAKLVVVFAIAQVVLLLALFTQLGASQLGASRVARARVSRARGPR